MDHPDIKHIRMYGTDPNEKYYRKVGMDSLGNEIWEDDDVYTLEDELYVVDEISPDARQILENHGAIRATF